MKIKKILSRNSRDFTAIFECEFCGSSIRGVGYDDAYFRTCDLPNMVCLMCRRSTLSGSVSPFQLRFPEDLTL